LQPSDADNNDLDVAVSQLKARLEANPDNFVNDDSARALLEKISQEVMKLSAQADDDEDNDEDDDSEGDRSNYGNSARRQAVRPYDLWRAAHEIDRPMKQASFALQIGDCADGRPFESIHVYSHSQHL
jgi:hypothetical protein